MSDMLPLGLGPLSGTVEKKRGRPKGARNKASGDLGKWFQSVSGSTPGQQLIELVAITPRDIRLAKAWAKSEKNVLVQGVGQAVDLAAFTPRALAMIWKAHNFALLNRMGLQEAWAMMFKASDILMPYVHQKQGAVEGAPPDKRAVIMVDQVALGSRGNPSQDVETQGEISFGPLPLTHEPSHIATETVKK